MFEPSLLRGIYVLGGVAFSATDALGLKVLRLIEQTMEIDELPENDERLLKKPGIKRDE